MISESLDRLPVEQDQKAGIDPKKDGKIVHGCIEGESDGHIKNPPNPMRIESVVENSH